MLFEGDMSQSREDIERWLNDCVAAARARNNPFNAWEKEFIESIQLQWNERQSLTSKQADTLLEVWGKI